MSSLRILKIHKDQIHFITFTVRNWYYVFDRHGRFKILEDSFVYCQKNKGLKIYAFVFMINHLHLIASAPDLISTIKEMKSFLSHEMQKNIIAAEPDIIKLFKIDGNKYQFWKSGNYPELIETEEFLEQKVNYIHYNPVRRGYVNQPEDWKYSSASRIPTKVKITNP